MLSVMANKFIAVVLFFQIFIDQGDGHWKEKDREMLRHDIYLYRKMAENIEHEIESFYDEYPEQQYKGDNVDRILYKHVTNILDRKTETRKKNENDDAKKEFFHDPRNVARNNRPSQVSNKISGETMKHEPFKNNNSTSGVSNSSNSAWPKFKDILLAMGKKYDWKNDRWIKVKEKIKQSVNKGRMKSKVEGISTQFHDKHKFSYKIVRLNKSKSRRSVVVAVTAVR